MKKQIILLLYFLIANNIFAQQVPNVKNSWLGNSSPFTQSFVPQGIEGMHVSKDGVVYTNVPWEEGGGNFTQMTTNGAVSHGEASHGWGSGGGSDAASNSTYVYWSMEMGNEGGGLVNPNRWPPAGKDWIGVSRRLKTNIKQGAPFTGGKGWPANSMLVVLEYTKGAEQQPWIHGLFATETELFVTIESRNIIKVYDANTMAFKREFTVNRPRQIAIDSYGTFWVAEGENATEIKRYTATGTQLPEAINLPDGSQLGDFCIDKNDRILIGDVGPREQVLIYTNINTFPELTSTFGTLGGIHSGISGRNAPLKFQQIRGLGVDTLGNIYIGNTQWHTGGQGTMVEKYNLASGTMEWKKYCVMFTDAMGIDAATDGGDVYGKVEHFAIDYTKPEGEDGKYSAYTINRYKYPSDPRLWEQFASVLVKNIKGQKFLAMSSMTGGLGAIFRFNAATDGDIAIPCILFGTNVNPRYPASINGQWMWRDLNANGQMEAGEYTQTVSYFIDGGNGAHMDDNGDIWRAGWQNILHSKCLGLDANNIPLYDGSYETIPVPAPHNRVKRVYYDVKLDRMYLAGGTTTQPTIDSWQSMGRAINRYDNWSTGNRTASISELVLPSITVNGFAVPISFKVVDEYIFVGFLGGSNDIPRLQLNIYKVSDNTLSGFIRAPWEGVGLFDVIQAFDGYKRKNGEYVIVTEENGRSKNVLYRWTPSGPLVETTNKLTANTNYVKFLPEASSQQLTVAANIAWSITGAPAWLTVTSPSGTGNGTVSLNASANTGGTSRTATITLAGGSVTNQITVFQEVNDVVAPANVSGLVATLIAPFSFKLDWASTTDNVMVTGYEVFKNGVLVTTTASVNLSFEALTPNTTYTMLVIAIDAAGNKTAGTTLDVKTLSVTYPYITARGWANNERPQRAFDGINHTTWHEWESTTWLQIQYAAPVVYNQYVIFSHDHGAHISERNPKNWILQGSNDGVNYTIVSTQNNQIWAAQATPKTFYFNNTIAYSHYRFNFFGGAGLQLGEIIFGNGAIVDIESPTVPAALTATMIRPTNLTLNWETSTDNVGVTAYEVFKDGNSLATVTAGTSFIITGLMPNTTYNFTVRAKDGLNNFSAQSLPLTLQTGFTALPVTLTTFAGSLTTNGNQILWTTASEKNNSHFDLQRKGDAAEFETITTVKGAGNTNTKQMYNYLDKNSPFKTTYYRLKQVDLNGKVDYSGTIAIKSNLNGKIVVFPNPFTTEISLNVNETLKPNTKVSIYDMLGRKQNVEFTINGSTINCKTGSLPTGSYILKVITDSGIISKVVIKN